MGHDFLDVQPPAQAAPQGGFSGVGMLGSSLFASYLSADLPGSADDVPSAEDESRGAADPTACLDLFGYLADLPFQICDGTAPKTPEDPSFAEEADFDADADGRPAQQGASPFLRNVAPARSRDEAWAERAQGLVGRWGKTNRVARTLDPKKRDAAGSWSHASEIIPKGTSLFISSAVLSDGALLCHLPQYGELGTAIQYRQVWLHHYEVDAAEEPRQVKAAREGDALVQQQDAESQQNSANRKTATRRLGQIARFDSSFYSVVGGVLDAAVPNPGDKSKLNLEFNLPVPLPAIEDVANLSFHFEFETSRDENGLRARVKVSAGVLVKASVWIAEAFAQAMLFGSLEAQGDDGTEVMRLLSLALYETVARHGGDLGQEVADLVWQNDMRTKTAEEMDDNDYAEARVGFDVKAGFKIEEDKLDKKVKGELGYRRSTGHRYERGQGEGVDQIKERAVESREFSGDFQVGEWAGKCNLAFETDASNLAVELKRDADLEVMAGFLSPKNLNKLLLDWVATSLGQVQNLLSGNSSLESANLARRIGAVQSLIGGIGFADSLAEGALVHSVAQRCHALKGVKFAQQLNIGLKIEGNTAQITISLDRLTAIEVGEERAIVHLLMEDISRILPPVQTEKFSLPS